MKCPYCNQEIPDGSKFCTYCGKSVETPENVSGTTDEADVKQAEASTQEGTTQGESVPEGTVQEDIVQKDTVQEGAIQAETASAVTAPEEPGVKEQGQEGAAGEAPVLSGQPSMDGSGAETETTGESTPSEGTPSESKADESATGEILQPDVTVEGGQPAPVEEKKKSNKNFAMGAALIIAVIALVAVAAKILPAKDVKTVVINAFKSVVAEGQVSPMEDIFGISELSERLKKESAEVSMTLFLDEITDPYMEYMATGKIGVTVMQDMENKKFSMVMGVGYADMNIVNFEMYWDNKDVAVAIPELSQKTFVFNYGGDIDSQVENSPYLGKYIEEDGVDLKAFKDYFEYLNKVATSEKEIFNVKALWERYKEGSKAIDDLKAAMTVEKGEKKTLVVDGKDQSCKSFKVNITKDALISFLKTSKDFFLADETIKGDFSEYITQIMNLSMSMSQMYGIDMETPEEIIEETWNNMEKKMSSFINQLEDSMGDINMVVYVDKKGRLVALDGTTTAEIEGTEYDVELNAELQGGYRLTANANATLTFISSDETVTFDLVKTGTYDDKGFGAAIELNCESDWEAITAKYEGNYTIADGLYDVSFSLEEDDYEILNITSDGMVQDLEKGKGFDLVLSSLTLEVPDEYLTVTFGGDYRVGPLSQTVELPEGEPMDILAASESDWMDVATEFQTNFLDMLMQFY